jgi:hypothetical protein
MSPERRRRLLTALGETILPAGEGGEAGAAEAGVAEYLERVFARLEGAGRLRFESGLELVEAMAAQACGRAFADCDGEERSRILARLQEVPHRISREFLSTLVGLVVEGFLCDPSHGGNRAGAGWRAVGYVPAESGR